MVGKLAKWLRILGYSTFYENSIEDSHLIKKALKFEGDILTRDAELVERLDEVDFLLIKSKDYLKQLEEVFKRYKLDFEREKMFRRCTLCNTKTESVKKEDIKNLIPPYVYKHQQEFSRCPKCDKIYWRGSHIDKTIERLKSVNVMKENTYD